MADDNVSMDAQVTVNQTRVLTRDDELRLFSLQTATKDVRFSMDKEANDGSVRQRVLDDAEAYYGFLTGGSNKKDGADA